MSKTALSEAYKMLKPQEQEAVKKMWRLQKQIEQEARRFRRKNVFLARIS